MLSRSLQLMVIVASELLRIVHKHPPEHEAVEQVRPGTGQLLALHAPFPHMKALRRHCWVCSAPPFDCHVLTSCSRGHRSWAADTLACNITAAISKPILGRRGGGIVGEGGVEGRGWGWGGVSHMPSDFVHSCVLWAAQHTVLAGFLALPFAG